MENPEIQPSGSKRRVRVTQRQLNKVENQISSLRGQISNAMKSGNGTRRRLESDMITLRAKLRDLQREFET